MLTDEQALDASDHNYRLCSCLLQLLHYLRKRRPLNLEPSNTGRNLDEEESGHG